MNNWLKQNVVKLLLLIVVTMATRNGMAGESNIIAELEGEWEAVCLENLRVFHMVNNKLGESYVTFAAGRGRPVALLFKAKAVLISRKFLMIKGVEVGREVNGLEFVVNANDIGDKHLVGKINVLVRNKILNSWRVVFEKVQDSAPLSVQIFNLAKVARELIPTNISE